MSDPNGPEQIADDALDVCGGVYVQEVPSGVKPRRGNGILFFDEADGVKRPTAKPTVFEPNDAP